MATDTQQPATPYMPQVRCAVCPDTHAPEPVWTAANVRTRHLNEAVEHARHLRELAEASTLKKGKSVVSDEELSAADNNVVRAEAALLVQEHADNKAADASKVSVRHGEQGVSVPPGSVAAG